MARAGRGRGAILTISMIRAVTTAIRARSMTEAALLLGISQSAVTQYVNKFELITGLKIIRRVGNGLFVEREDIAEIMDKITELSDQMERLVQAQSSKPTVAIPYSIAALIGMRPELVQWASSKYNMETMAYRELARQSGQNSFDVVVRPLRVRETDFEHQFTCLFQLLQPLTWSDGSAKQVPLPIILPDTACPTHSAAIDFLQSRRINFSEVARSEDVGQRANYVKAGSCASILPAGIIRHHPDFAETKIAETISPPISVRFTIVTPARSAERSNPMAFLDEFCSKLQDFGVASDS